MNAATRPGAAGVVEPERAGVRARPLLWGALITGFFALLPFVLSTYQVSIATEVLIFALLAISIDVLSGYAGRVSLGHGSEVST